jgi:HlyD family type I secretion membrane fusion protein
MAFDLNLEPRSPGQAAAYRAERDIQRWTLIGILILLLSFGLTVFWSVLAPIASAVVAPGLIKVDTSRKKVQHQEGGVIKEILVRDGDHVKAGQVLIRLDETRAGASHGVLQAQYDAALAQLARLEAERDKRAEIAWPAELASRKGDPKVAEILRAQETLFIARRVSLKGQLDILDKQIASKQSEIQGLLGQQAAKEAQLASLKTELAGLSDLLTKGMVEKTKYRAQEREIARLEGERGEHVSDIAATRSAIGEKELQKFQIRKSFHEEVVAEMRKVQTEAFDYLERMGAAKYVLAQTELKAPVNGTVVDLKAHTQGGVVAPGEVLLEIVPANDRLVVEAHIRPEDIDRVHLDLDAGIKLSAFDQRRTPELNGKVSYVSADAIEDQKTGHVFFVTKIEVPESELTRLQGQKVQPGMLADVFVRTGERTFLEYLLHPIIVSFDKAWRER